MYTCGTSPFQIDLLFSLLTLRRRTATELVIKLSKKHFLQILTEHWVQEAVNHWIECRIGIVKVNNDYQVVAGLALILANVCIGLGQIDVGRYDRRRKEEDVKKRDDKQHECRANVFGRDQLEINIVCVVVH